MQARRAARTVDDDGCHVLAQIRIVLNQGRPRVGCSKPAQAPLRSCDQARQNRLRVNVARLVQADLHCSSKTWVRGAAIKARCIGRAFCAHCGGKHAQRLARPLSSAQRRRDTVQHASTARKLACAQQLDVYRTMQRDVARGLRHLVREANSHRVLRLPTSSGRAQRQLCVCYCMSRSGQGQLLRRPWRRHQFKPEQDLTFSAPRDPLRHHKCSDRNSRHHVRCSDDASPLGRSTCTGQP